MIIWKDNWRHGSKFCETDFKAFPNHWSQRHKMNNTVLIQRPNNKEEASWS